MQIKELIDKPNFIEQKKLFQHYSQLEKLLNELKKKDLSKDVIKAVNDEVEHVNASSGSELELRKVIKKRTSRLFKIIEQKDKIVSKNHYRNIWLGVGMAIFGLPIGVIFGVLYDNMALLAIGLPVGMVIGIAVGTQMDKKAFKAGRQIDLEII